MKKMFFLIFLLVNAKLCLCLGDGTFIEIVDAVINYTNVTIQDILKEYKELNELSPSCKQSVKKYGQTNELITQFLFSSSKNKNDLTTYRSCVKNVTNTKDELNKAYVIMIVDQRDQENDKSLDIYGFCLASGCNNEDYKSLIDYFNEYLENPLKTQKNATTALSVEEYMGKFSPKYLWNLIPLFLILIQFTFVIWNKIPATLIKCMKKRKNKRDESDIKSIFSFNKNYEQLFRDKTDNGLTYIKGLRGLSMFIYIFGQVYVGLYNASFRIKTKNDSLIAQIFNIFFYAGIKFSPKILLSCSGYILIHKLICYTDECIEEDREKCTKMVKKPFGAPSGRNTPFANSLEDELEESSFCEPSLTDSSSFKENNKIRKKYLFRFIMYQFHKYVIFVLMLVFYRYGFYYTVLLVKSLGPSWVYFKERILKTTLLQFILALLGCNDFLFLDGKESRDCFLNYFWLVYNEIVFFVLTTVVAFFFLRNHYRLDRFFTFTSLILFFIKLLFYYFSKSLNAMEYFEFIYYGKFQTSLIYNYIYYLFGGYFSLFNYTIQKQIQGFDKVDSEGKEYLYVPVKMTLKMNRKTRKSLYCLGTFLILIITGMVVLNSIIIYFCSVNDYTEEFRKYIMGSYMNIDSEIFVALCHIVCIIFIGDNLINKALNSSFWIGLNKLYFSFILITPSTILYVFYQSETRIYLDVQNCLLYTIICWILISVSCLIVYPVFESPYKKLIKFVLKRKEKK